MAKKKPITREKAIAWWGILFVISVFGSAVVMWRFFPGRPEWLLIFLYGALFVCASILGMKADREMLRQSLGAGLKTLIEPAPMVALAVVVLEALIFWQLGFSWVWRSIAPFGLGVLAGTKWAQQESAPSPDGKDDKDKVQHVDFWEP